MSNSLSELVYLWDEKEGVCSHSTCMLLRFVWSSLCKIMIMMVLVIVVVIVFMVDVRL